MQDLVSAFEIFAKYTDDKYPLGCENVDEESGWLYVYVDPASVSVEDNDLLHELGFWVQGDDNKYTMWVDRRGG